MKPFAASRRMFLTECVRSSVCSHRSTSRFSNTLGGVGSMPNSSSFGPWSASVSLFSAISFS